MDVVSTIDEDGAAARHSSRTLSQARDDVEAWRERWRRTEAAMKLQAAFRGKVVRRILDVRRSRRRRFRGLIVSATGAALILARVRKKILAAKLIQAVYRGGKTRCKISKMLAERLEWAITFVQRLWRIRRSAIRIQSYFRGWRQWMRHREVLAGEGMKQFVVRRNENLILKATLDGGEMRVRFPVGTCCLVSINSGVWRLHTDGNAKPVGELKLRGRGRVYCSTPSVISVLPPVAKRCKLGPFSGGRFLSLLWILSGDASDALVLGNRTFTVNTRGMKIVVSDTSGLDKRQYNLATTRESLGIFLEVLGKSAIRLSLRSSDKHWLALGEKISGWEEFRKLKLSGGAKLGDACPVIPEEVMKGRTISSVKNPADASPLSARSGVGQPPQPKVEEMGVYTLSNSTFSRESTASVESSRPKRSVLATRPPRVAESTSSQTPTPGVPISAARVFRKSMEQHFGTRRDLGDGTSYSSSSSSSDVFSATSVTSDSRDDRNIMRGIVAVSVLVFRVASPEYCILNPGISCVVNNSLALPTVPPITLWHGRSCFAQEFTTEPFRLVRTPTDQLTCGDPCGATWAVTHAPLSEQFGGRRGGEIYQSFKVLVRGVQNYPTDDGHHGMFGIGFATRDDISEIPGKKNNCLFGYNFSSPVGSRVRDTQRRTLYTSFYDGRQWMKLQESLLPGVGDEVELVLIGGRICVLVNHWAVFVSDELDRSLLRRLRTQRMYGIVDLCGGPVYDLICQPNPEVDSSVIEALKAKKPTHLMSIHA
ncbi:hypothetical protein FOZ61_000950 [Perkinsus olseni]|uniref:Uncharacterized protein n=1 Tax=Perkinsus olseni TaxID=32597 RepID=A0A7J6LYQ9_PEROL|nr:hypothetical protein FOZ61_000950 [Perkinsus olseni]